MALETEAATVVWGPSSSPIANTFTGRWDWSWRRMAILSLPTEMPCPPGAQRTIQSNSPRKAILVATYQLDAGAPGRAFGIAIRVSEGAVRFAVDDDLNTVTVAAFRQLKVRKMAK